MPREDGIPLRAMEQCGAHRMRFGPLLDGDVWIDDEVVVPVRLPIAAMSRCKDSSSGKPRIGTMCSLPLLAPMVWSSSIGGGSLYGAATSPWLARNSAITSSFQLRSLARNAAAASSRSSGVCSCDNVSRLHRPLRRCPLTFLRYCARTPDIATCGEWSDEG